MRWTQRLAVARVVVVTEQIWDADAARRYDTPGTGMFAPEVLGPTVDRLAELAGGGRALELAIGTGRVAVPLAARGVPVTGIELSGADGRAAPHEGRRGRPSRWSLGDMATAAAPGEFALVYLVFNTISNLLTQAEQVACFRNAARHLAPGGRFVIELWVPELRTLPPGTAGHGRACTSPATSAWTPTTSLDQQVVSHHFRFGDEQAGASSSAARTATSGRPSST